MSGTMIKAASYAMASWYREQNAVRQHIFTRSCVAGAISLIPLPVASEVACLVNQVGMYHSINKMVGVKFTDQFLKNIGKFIVSQCAGAAACIATVIGAAAVAKWIPGLNFVAGVVEVPAVGIANYMCGEVYYRMLGNVLKDGSVEGFDEDELMRKMKESVPSKSEIDGIGNIAKTKMKGAKYSDYKDEARECGRRGLAT